MGFCELKLEMYQPQQQQPGTAVVYTATTQPIAFAVTSRVCESYNSRQSVACGVLLVISGVLSIVFNGFGMDAGEAVSYIGHGIWCGVVVSKIC